MIYGVFVSWINMVGIEAERDNARVARSALAEAKRTRLELVKTRALDQEVDELGDLISAGGLAQLSGSRRANVRRFLRYALQELQAGDG